MKDDVWVVIFDAWRVEGAWQIKDGKYEIGRGRECDIKLSYPTISRRHAVLMKQDGKLMIRDLGSRNGTFVAGVRIREAEIAVGESFRLGDVTLDLQERRPTNIATPSRDDEDTPPVRGDNGTGGNLDGSTLSPRQLQVLRMLLRGYPEKRIATECHLNPHTVHWHVKEVYKEFHVHSRAQLAHTCHGRI
jgi:pSer/pThr/pTyr-binding forkhead associated (FHA) protein